MRAGLNVRSQSAYAAPAPNPVVRATGHARPEKQFLYFGIGTESCGVWSRTAEEDDGCDDANAKTDTAVQRDLGVMVHGNAKRFCMSATHDFTSKSATAPRFAS
jgi:hypothetical protein